MGARNDNYARINKEMPHVLHNKAYFKSIEKHAEKRRPVNISSQEEEEEETSSMIAEEGEGSMLSLSLSMFVCTLLLDRIVTTHWAIFSFIEREKENNAPARDIVARDERKRSIHSQKLYGLAESADRVVFMGDLNYRWTQLTPHPIILCTGRTDNLFSHFIVSEFEGQEIL